MNILNLFSIIIGKQFDGNLEEQPKDLIYSGVPKVKLDWETITKEQASSTNL